MVTLTPTSITNKDTATPSQAMVTTPCTTKAMVGGSMVVQGVVTIAWLGVAVSLFVIEVGVNVTIAIGLVSPRVCLMVVTVISPKSMDVNSGAPSRCVHLSSITISIVLALCPI